MRKKHLSWKKAAVFLVILLGEADVFAQQRIIGTVRPRFEYRDGVGNLPLTSVTPSTANPSPTGAFPASTPNSDAAMFVSQRTNLLYGYKWTKLDFQVQLRDARVWGQDASTINNSDGARLYLHEAWGEFTIATAADTNCWLKIDNMALKVGRQEIVYDDVRLLGNLDWLQQGRRHDAAILKLMHKGYQVDIGAAFNQNTDNFQTRGVFYNPQNSTSGLTPHKSGVGFTVPLNTNPNTGATYAVGGTPVAYAGAPPGTNAIGQMYKSMQYLYASRKWGQTKISALVFKDDFAKYRDSAAVPASGANPGRGAFRYYYTDKQVNSRWTMGANFSTQTGNASGFGKIMVAGGGFTQRGNNKSGQNLEAYMANLALTYSKGKISIGPAIDYLSGNTFGATDMTDNNFDPLYGTPHRWWGYMDYYYVGTGAPAGGLVNSQIRAKYTASRYFLTVDYHHFASDGELPKLRGNSVGKNMGDEIDIVLNYNVNKFVNLEVAYCKYFGTNTTAIAKGQNPDMVRKDGNFAYAMLTIRPDFLFTPPVAISPGTMNNDQLSGKVKELQDQIDELKRANGTTPADTITPENK